MQKAYNRNYWENLPSDKSPIDERNLNNIEAGIDTLDDRIVTLDTTKAERTEVSTLFSGVEYDEATGIITFTRKNGAVVTIDTPFEKIALDIYYNPETEMLTLPLIDGTRMEVDLSRLITEFEFSDSDTISFSVKPDGQVTAVVKEGIIEERHLQPNYLAEIKVEVGKAQASAQASAQSESDSAYNAKLSQSYAVGMSSIREGEDEDNAKYYKEKAEQIYQDLTRGNVTSINGKTGDVELTAKDVGALSSTGNAASATKAEQDGNGKVIADTYLPKILYVPNSMENSGYVSKGEGHPNQVWKTDENGNPGWRDEGGGLFVTFANGTWNQVKTMLDMHYAGLIDIADYWSVGDEKTITVSAMSATGVNESHAKQEVTLVIIGIEHDDLSNPIGTKNKAAISIQFKTPLKEKGYINLTDSAWYDSSRYIWMDNVFKNALPNELQPLIKNVIKKTNKGYNDRNIQQSNDYCWLPSYSETGCLRNWSSILLQGEGTCYEYYEISSNQIKDIDGNPVQWWLRTPGYNASNGFGYMDAMKTTGNISLVKSNTNQFLAPGFCI